MIGRVVISRQGFNWEKSTPNRYVCNLAHGVDIQVERSPNWRQLKQAKPWRIRVFGSIWMRTRYNNDYAHLNKAMFAAENIAIDVLDAIARKLGFELRAS